MTDGEHPPVRRNPRHVLVVEDDEATATYFARALERAEYRVTTAGSAPDAIDVLVTTPIDALLVDIGLPGRSGFDLVTEIKERWPAIPIALTTADASMDVAVRALRSQVDDFLAKPVAPDQLARQVERLLQVAEARRNDAAERVLAIGAHPDDVEIGVGGILLAHRDAGDITAVLTMSRGSRGGDQGRRAEESAQAAAILGARLVLEDLEDTRIPESDPTVGIIERVIAEFQPTIVYTHTVHDVHQDHRNVHRATLVAARGVPGVYCYESPSATVDFHPARFASIEPHIDEKLDVIASYRTQTETRAYLDPELIRSTGRYWGRFGDARYCEPLEVVRDRSSSRRFARPQRATASV
ncbi:response regulator [Desertimonas flava]|uniref:response regulator n=1 Tax=Desertimonas flava TaxID=2064846 RepID=UPI0013C4C8CF|nr:response regulator [Desertimonas flava]